MDLQGLEAFWWIAQTGSFNKAAERLYLTQPSVTARIQALERAVGLTLFERRPKGVVLTEAGQLLLPHAERLLEDLRQAERALAAFAAGRGGHLAVAAAVTIGIYTLPKLLVNYRQAFPEVEIAVHTGRSATVQQLLLDDQVHLGLVHAPLAVDPLLSTLHLAPEPSQVVVHPSHPLAGARGVPPDVLQAEPFITNEPGSGYRALVEQWLVGLGLSPQVSMELDSIEAIKQMVAQGLGVAVLPVSAVAAELANETLAPVELEGAPPPERQTLLLFRRGRAWSPISTGFVEVIKAHYGL